VSGVDNLPSVEKDQAVLDEISTTSKLLDRRKSVDPIKIIKQSSVDENSGNLIKKDECSETLTASPGLNTHV